MIRKHILLQIRQELRRIDDGSDDFKEMFKYFSWFLEKFNDYCEKVSYKSKPVKVEQL